MINLDLINKYCICLVNKIERVNNTNNLKELFNNCNFNIKYVIKHNYYNNVYKQLNFDFPGQLGCAISHYEIVNIAYNIGYDYIMICEDDITFNKEQLYEFINNAPEDFDILQFYALDLELPQKSLIDKNQLLQLYNDKIYWYKVTQECTRYGTVLYILNRNGMKYYLDRQNEQLNIADNPFLISYNYNINHYIPTIKIISEIGNSNQSTVRF